MLYKKDGIIYLCKIKYNKTSNYFFRIHRCFIYYNKCVK